MLVDRNFGVRPRGRRQTIPACHMLIQGSHAGQACAHDEMCSSSSDGVLVTFFGCVGHLLELLWWSLRGMLLASSWSASCAMATSVSVLSPLLPPPVQECSRCQGAQYVGSKIAAADGGRSSSRTSGDQAAPSSWYGRRQDGVSDAAPGLVF